MTVDEFIQQKSPQLANYGDAFFQEHLPLAELQLFLWDTLEEWYHQVQQDSPLSDRERVFWFLLYSFQKWPDWALRGNAMLRERMLECCRYLHGEGQILMGCDGIRPAA